jgi:Carboxypeptidase regulatory-like domain
MGFSQNLTILRNINFFVMRSILLAMLMSIVALGQSGVSVVRGTITDQQGQAIAGATVTLTSSDKNFSRKQTTGNDGGYVFSALPPGTYSLDVTTTNFKKLSITGIVALVDTANVVDGQLEVGAVTETLTVTSASEPPLNTTDATLGNAIENRRIVELPLNARNIVGLLSLQAGVTRGGEVTGSRRDQANITIDGIDANEQQTGLDVVAPGGIGAFSPGTGVGLGNAFSSVLRMNPDAVQELRVTTSNPAATQGRSSGAQISLITKSGTNEYHGSLYHFHRNTVTTTNDYFNNALGRDDQGQPIAGRPALIRNIFGGSFGGPIVKDRFFFFFSYEGRRDAAELSVLRNVPTATLRQGIVQYVNQDGGITTLTPERILGIYPETGGVNPAGLAILQSAPLPNDFTTGDGLNRAGFRFNAPISTRQNASIARLDYTLNDRHSVSFRGNYQEDNYRQAPAFPNTPSPNFWVHPKGFAASHHWAVNNNIVNTARIGLTRLALTADGDNNGTSISFRDVYSPLLNTRTLRRTLPSWNVVDDVSWVKNTHTFQFGTNIRFIRNSSVSFANSYDSALINPLFYAGGGDSLRAPDEIARTLAESFEADYATAAAAALGRFSQYSVNALYDISGQPLPIGTPAERKYATDEYEFYGQDSWKIRPNLTLTFGLRWGINTPVYEANGLQVAPDTNLGDFFQRRVASAEAGEPLNDLIEFTRGGKANNGPGLYPTDKNNFAPNISVAWSPDFGDNLFGRAFGRGGKSVIRAGFRMVYDRIGSQLAVSSESENSFGFSSETTNDSESTDVTDQLGPLVTTNPNIRAVLGTPTPLIFPLAFPADGATRIIAGIDQSIRSPKQYSWNLTYGRELPKGFSFEVGYVGRAARNLLLTRDIMQLNNLRDRSSGQDWYTAAGTLNDLRNANTPIEGTPAIPYFENLFPALPGFLAFVVDDPSLAGLTPSQAAFLLHSKDGFGITDFTSLQSLLDDVGIFENAFFHPQYAALQTLSSVGQSNYHAGFVTLRQRLGNSLSFDFNYTYSKSFDNSSTLETQRVLGTAIRNSLNPNLEYSLSDFDVRHNLNANWLLELPFGRGRKFFDTRNSILEGIIGGWQLTGITRFNTGLPTGTPGDSQWATNWQLTSNGVRLRPVKSSPNANVDGSPNLFSDPLQAYNSFRNARAGETGERNINTLRFPSYFVLDTGLSKSFRITESQRLQFRWEVFNVTNTQPFGAIDSLTLNPDPFNATAPSAGFGNFIGSQVPVGETRPGRTMQFALRYTF